MFEMAGSVSGKRVLDVGCGDGAYSIEIARRGAIVTGIDISAEMIDAARRRAEERGAEVELLVGDASRVPFPDGTFDVVLAVTVLCFVGDAAAAVREMARVLAPGGRLVLGDLGRRSIWAAWRRLRGLLGSATWRTARFRTPRELRLLVSQAGLSVERLRGSIYYPPIPALATRMAPLDEPLGRLTAEGAALVAIAATKQRR